jgi:hypothetical protein
MDGICEEKVSAFISRIEENPRYKNNKEVFDANRYNLDFYWIIGKDLARYGILNEPNPDIPPNPYKELRMEFCDWFLFEPTNLDRMKQFYIYYSPEEVVLQLGGRTDGYELPALLAYVPWSHHIKIFERCSSIEEAIIYLKKDIEYEWDLGDMPCDL